MRVNCLASERHRYRRLRNRAISIPAATGATSTAVWAKKIGKISGRNPIHAPADGSSLAIDLAIEKATIPHVIRNVATKYQKNRVEKLIMFPLVVRPPNAQPIQHVGQFCRGLIDPRFGGKMDLR